VLAALLVSFGLSIFSEILFETEAPEHPGYVIAVAEPEAAARRRATARPRSHRRAAGERRSAAGEASAKKCATCHTFAQGRGQQDRPEPVGDRESSRSPALRVTNSASAARYAGQSPTWTFDSLDAFLHDPKGACRGPRWRLPA
jgi:cytochrome c